MSSSVNSDALTMHFLVAKIESLLVRMYLMEDKFDIWYSAVMNQEDISRMRALPTTIMEMTSRIDDCVLDVANMYDKVETNASKIIELFLNQDGNNGVHLQTLSQIYTAVDLLDRNQTTQHTTITELNTRLTTVTDNLNLTRDFIVDSMNPKISENAATIQALTTRLLDIDVSIYYVKNEITSKGLMIEYSLNQYNELRNTQVIYEARFEVIDTSLGSISENLTKIEEKSLEETTRVNILLEKSLELDRSMYIISQKNDQYDMKDVVHDSQISGLVQSDLDQAYQQIATRLATLEENYAFTKYVIGNFMSGITPGGASGDGSTPAGVITQFVAINDQITDLNYKFTTLNSKHHIAVDFNATTFTAFDARITAAESGITRDNTALGTLTQRVTILEQYGSAGSGGGGSGMTPEYYQAINTQLTAINTQVATINNNLTATRLDVSRHTSYISDLISDANELDTAVGIIETDIVRVKADITGLKEGVDTPVSVTDYRITQALTELLWYYMADIDFATSRARTINDSHQLIFDHMVLVMQMNPDTSNTAIGRYMLVRERMADGRFFLPLLYQYYYTYSTISSYVQFLFHQYNELDIGQVCDGKFYVVSSIDTEYNRLHSKIVYSNDYDYTSKDTANGIKEWLTNFKSGILTNQNRSKYEADTKVDNVESTVTTYIVRVDVLENTVNHINTALSNLNYNPSQVALITQHDDMIKLLFATLFSVDIYKATGQLNWELQRESVRNYIENLNTINTDEKAIQLVTYDRMMNQYNSKVMANAAPVYEEIVLYTSTNQDQEVRIAALEQLTLSLDGTPVGSLQQLFQSTLYLTDNQLVQEVNGTTPMTFGDFRRLIAYYQLRPEDGVVFVTNTNLDIVLNGYVPLDGNQVTLSTLSQYVRTETLALNYTAISDTNNLASNISSLQTLNNYHVTSIADLYYSISNIHNTLYTIYYNSGNVDLSNYYNKGAVDTMLLFYQYKPASGAYVNANDLTALLASYVTKTDDLNAYATKDFVLANYLRIGDALVTYVTVPVFEYAIANIYLPDLSGYVTSAIANEKYAEKFQLNSYSTTANTNQLFDTWTPKGYNAYTSFLQWTTNSGVQAMIDSFGHYTIQDAVTTTWPTSYSVVPTKRYIETYFAYLLIDLQAAYASATYLKSGYILCPDVAASYVEPFTIACKGAITSAVYIYSDALTRNISVIDMTWNACPNGDYWYPIFIMTDLKQGSANGINSLPSAYKYLGCYAPPTIVRGSLTKTGCKVALGEIPNNWTTELGITVILIANSDAVTFGMDAIISGQDMLSSESSYV